MIQTETDISKRERGDMSTIRYKRNTLKLRLIHKNIIIACNSYIYEKPFCFGSTAYDEANIWKSWEG